MMRYGLTACGVALSLTAWAGGEEDDAAALKEARLAADRQLLESQRDAMEAYGQADLILQSGRESLAALGEDDRWIPGRDGRGWLLAKIVEALVVWNAPAEGRDVPLYADRDAEFHAHRVIVDFAKQLASQDIDFLLVHVPSRVQIYPELLVDLPDEGFAGFAPGSTEFLLGLANAGVEVLDLVPAFAAERAHDDRDELFLDYNTHWTPRGAELAARLVSERLRTYPWFEEGLFKAGVDFQVREGTFDFRTTNSDPPPNTERQPVAAHCVVGVDGKAPPAAISSNSQLVLLGDSFPGFLGFLSCDFITQTMRFTGHRLDAITNKGGGIKTCRDALKRRRDRLENEHIVIWLMPSPNLIPDPEWKKVRIFRRER